ncbi:MAG: nucleotidyl transferase AbiEii/AbiGii toxin family protein [Bdellovibrionales bacterium]|nr:nucleotidyl transferase AbiEii/AbiGii toxin family protein [Bdellovibrionales bacterium]
MPDSLKNSVLAKARSWATKRGLFGAQAFLKYVILRFTENLNQVSDEFVLKGGNLLWIYIGTPRATLDLDLTTLRIDSHSRARQLIENACDLRSDISFSLNSFKEVEQEGKLGAELGISYRTDQGASNRFEVDLVYTFSTDAHEISSPINPEIKIRSATIENIILDKLAACHRFGSGNSRMKDYDDLWRLSQSSVSIDADRLQSLLRIRKISSTLDPAWRNPGMDQAWKNHRKKYRDLPDNLGTVFLQVNAWLNSL